MNGANESNDNATSSSNSIVCSGCKQGLEETSDSVVVSFGEGLWHVDCFRCAKCNSLVEHDTNLLLLADGSPVCENCSYVCSSCGQSISNEAIVTGDESYHADCFRCKSCNTRIEELVFAKTSQGIYCMGCHNERVARTRKHAESKRNKSLRRKDGSGRHHTSSSSQQTRDPTSTSTSSRPRIGTGSHASSSNSLDPHLSSSTQPTSIGSQRSVSASSSYSYHDSFESAPPSGSSAQDRPVGLNKLREREKDKARTTADDTPRLGSELSRADSPSRPALEVSDASSADERRPVGSSGRRSVSHSRSGSTATLGERDIRKQRSFDVSSQGRSHSPQLSQSQPSQQPERTTDGGVRPATAGGSGMQSVGVSISRSGSPSPSLLGTSPTDTRALPIERSPSRSELHLGTTSFSPPARSSSNEANATGPGSGGLSLPKSNKNANRRSGFYGVMAIPQVTSPGSAPASGSLSPGKDTDGGSQTQDDYFDRSSSSAVGETSVRTIREATADESDTQPLSISAKTAPQRKQIGTQQQWGTSSTLASNGSSSGYHDSASGSMSSSSTDAHSMPASSSTGSASRLVPTTHSQAKTGHMSFYDPDVLVFLDAVNDGNDKTPAALNKRSSRLSQVSSTPTRPHLDTATPQALKTDSSSPATAVNGTLASPSASPRLSSYQSRHLNLVADGQLPAGRQREGSPIVSPSGIGDSSEAEEDEDEQEHLSPLAQNGPSRRDSRSNYHGHGLGLSTNSAGSARHRLASSDTNLAYDDEDHDEVTEDTLRKVRDSIRRSRGGSTSRSNECADGMKLDVDLVELLIKELEQTKNRMKELQKNYNAIRRASRQAFEGFSMAREEYDREVAARRDAEFEMLRLKEQMKEQAAKLGGLDEIEKKRELLQRRSNDLRSSVVGIEKELSKMKAERDMTVAEMEELAGLPKTGDDAAAVPERLSVALNSRLSSLREEYRSDLEALGSQREALKREVTELQQARDLFSEESNTLNDRNTELATQAAEANRKLESLKKEIASATKTLAEVKAQTALAQSQSQSVKEKALPAPASIRAGGANPALNASTGSSSTGGYASTPMNQSASSASQRHVLPSTPNNQTSDDQSHAASNTFIAHKVDPVASQATVRKFKWGSKKGLERPVNASISKHPLQPRATGPQELSARQHNFMATSILRPVRCEHCGDKMWGIGEQRCQACGIYCHTKCIPSFHIICNSASVIEEAPDAAATSNFTTMFGNDLVAQCLTENRLIPTVVTTCIEAVEASGIEYEGIYRKSGGMGQTKLISSCFDRGEPFDLQDEDRFNDISAVTSVLKNYFRSLPNPLYTFEFHQDFCSLPQIADSAARISACEALLHKLPEQHFATLKTLMMHLHRIHRASKDNKMTPANLGVVFGPTLLRSPDPSQEFSQMHLKARVVELSVENAPALFAEPFKGS